MPEMIEVMVTIPTPQELRRKAEECQDDARTVQTPGLHVQLLQIADEYEASPSALRNLKSAHRSAQAMMKL
jgi:hypothetical protein